MTCEDPDLIGLRVIIRSNNDEPNMVGTLISWQKFQHGQEFPIVRLDNGTELLCMAVLLPYQPELLTMLNLLSHKAAWDLAAGISLLCQVRSRKSSYARGA